MKEMLLLVLLLSPCTPGVAAAATPAQEALLDRPLPDDLEAANALLDEVKWDLADEDFFDVADFQLRAMWCEKEGRPIHRGKTIRQALALTRRLDASGGSLISPETDDKSSDLRRYCGE